MLNAATALLVLISGMSAFASEKCERRAVSLARSNSNLGQLAGFSEIPTAKDYLLGYRVQFVSKDGRRTDSFRIILMKSSCSTVSMIREF